MDFRFAVPERGEPASDGDGRLGSGGGGRSLEVASKADSGTRHKVPWSILFEGARLLAVEMGEGPGRVDGERDVCEVSRLGRPRAAAAHDKRVERLARRAASWSTGMVWLGAMRV